MHQLGICIPWDSPFVFTDSWITIMNMTIPEGVKHKYFLGNGWCPAQRHNRAVYQAINWGADYILIVGSDQVYEENMIIRLAAYVPEWDMVSGLVPGRGTVGPKKGPFQSIGYQLKDPTMSLDELSLDIEKDHWNIIDETMEPQEIHSTGTGFLLMKTSILTPMPTPFFIEFLIAGEQSYARHCIMDTVFTMKCTLQQGARMLLDTTCQPGHLDIFPIDTTYPERFKDKAEDKNWSPMSDWEPPVYMPKDKVDWDKVLLPDSMMKDANATTERRG